MFIQRIYEVNEIKKNPQPLDLSSGWEEFITDGKYVLQQKYIFFLLYGHHVSEQNKISFLFGKKRRMKYDISAL